MTKKPGRLPADHTASFSAFVAKRYGGNWILWDRAKLPRGYEHCTPIKRKRYNALRTEYRRQRYSERAQAIIACLVAANLSHDIIKSAIIDAMVWATEVDVA